MTHRNQNPEPLLVPTVIINKGPIWGAETQKVAQTDAQRVLEALMAEVGVEGEVSALNNQGFKGEAYRYLLAPLYDEARWRRHRVRIS